MSETLIKLTNPEFGMEFAGKEYRVRKATIEKMAQFTMKARELNAIGGDGVERDPTADYKLLAFCIYIILKEHEWNNSDFTEDFVFKNCPATANPTEVLTLLGFFNPDQKQTKPEIQQEKKMI